MSLQGQPALLSSLGRPPSDISKFHMVVSTHRETQTAVCSVTTGTTLCYRIQCNMELAACPYQIYHVAKLTHSETKETAKCEHLKGNARPFNPC